MKPLNGGPHPLSAPLTVGGLVGGQDSGILTAARGACGGALCMAYSSERDAYIWDDFDFGVEAPAHV